MPAIGPLIFKPVVSEPASASIAECNFRDACAAVDSKHPLLDIKFTTATILEDSNIQSSEVLSGPLQGSTVKSVITEAGTDLLGRVELVDDHLPVRIRLINSMTATTTVIAEEMERAVFILAALPETTITRNDHCLAVRENNAYFVRPGMSYELSAGALAIEVGARRRTGRAPGVDAFEQADLDFDDRIFEKRSHVTSLFTTVTRLITTPNLQIERVRFMGELEQEIPYAEPVIWWVLKGSGLIQYDNGEAVPFRVGDGVLLPAALPDGKLRTDVDCDWLEITLPTASDLADFGRPDAAQLQARDGTPAAPIGINIDPKLRGK